MGKRKPTEWQLLVKKVMDENKNKPGFKFGDALKLAKKMYGSKNKTAKKGGTCGSCEKGGEGEENSMPAEQPAVPEPAPESEMDSTAETQSDLEQNVPPPPAVTGGKRKSSVMKQTMKTMRNFASRANLQSGVTSLSKDSRKLLSKFKFAGKTKKNRKNKKGGAAISNTNGGTPYFSSN